MHQDLSILWELRTVDRWIENGRHFGYPECCIQWFAWVWGPTHSYLFNTGQLKDNPIKKMFTGLDDNSDLVPWIKCPKCRGGGICQSDAG